MADCDIIILGAGPGGYVAAFRAAQRGASVVLVEKDAVGGTCLNRGCIPTKALLQSAEVYRHCRHAADYGVVAGEVGLDPEKMFQRKDVVVKRLVTGIEKLLVKRKVRLVRGDGRLTAPGTVVVRTAQGEETVTGSSVIIATGSEELVPPPFPVDGERIFTSREALTRPVVPKSMIVIGGGVVGCEFATYYHSLGAQVTLVEMLPRLLPMADTQISRYLAMAFKKRKLKLELEKKIECLEATGEGVRAQLADGRSLEAECALVAVGRSLNTEGIGLAELGVDYDPRGGIVVDERMRTSVDGVYAIGDVVGKFMLAHVATAQGIVAVTDATGGKAVMDYDAVPSCIWSHPEVAFVGKTEDELKEAGVDYKVGRFAIAASGKALAAGEAEGSVKVLIDGRSDKLLGWHMIGHASTELVAEATLAIRNDLTGEDLCRTIHAHPTMAEAVYEAAEGAYGLALHGV